MIKNLFDNWYVDWNFTAPTGWRKSDFTYTIYMEDNDGRGRKNIILKGELPIEDQLYIESILKEAGE